VGKLSLPVLRFTGLVCVHTTAGKTSLTSAFLFTPARVPAIRRFSLDLSLFGGFSRQAKEAASIRRVQVTVEEGDVEVKRVRRGTWGHSWTSQESPVPHTGLIVEFVGCLLWHQKRRDLRFFQGGGAKVSEIRAFFGKNRMLFMFLEKAILELSRANLRSAQRNQYVVIALVSQRLPFLSLWGDGWS